MVECCSLKFMGFSDYKIGVDGSLWSKRPRGRFKPKVPVKKKIMWRRLNPQIHYGPFPTRKEYRRAKLTRDDGIHCSILVHILVLRAFHGNQPEGMESCHNDGDGLNNHETNLRWDTPVNNQKDRIKHGTNNQGQAALKGEKSPDAKLTEKQVLRIRRHHSDKRRWLGYVRTGAKYGVDWSTIRNIVKRRTWKHLP